ncbi:MAG: F0F1 ATP synthase subunit A [Terracidiphilus sp.]
MDHSDAFPIGMVWFVVRRESSNPNGRSRYRVLSRVSWRLAEAGGLPGWLLTGAHCYNAAHTSPAREEHPHPARRWTMIIPSVHITSDQQIFWQYGFVKLNETIVTTWAMMIAMTLGSFLITRKFATERTISRWQSALEMIVTGIEGQIKEVGLSEPRKYLAFLGTLFLFIGTCSVCIVIPGFTPPTGSLSTTAALALCVFIAVPLFGIREQGIACYLKTYIKPTPIMLPFNIISELSRTLALAIRLFGNMMSGVMIVGILLTITPFIFPIVMTLLGLLTGSVQAYIFSILAAVYIAAATSVTKPKPAAEAQPEPSHA